VRKVEDLNPLKCFSHKSPKKYENMIKAILPVLVLAKNDDPDPIWGSRWIKLLAWIPARLGAF
jgi:hypothetical protein